MSNFQMNQRKGIALAGASLVLLLVAGAWYQGSAREGPSAMKLAMARHSESVLMEKNSRPAAKHEKSEAPQMLLSQVPVLADGTHSLVTMAGEQSLSAAWSSRKLIRTGQLTLEVTSFSGGYSRLERIASDHGGYISEMKADQRQQGRASGTISLRIPPLHYFQTLASIRELGKVQEESISTQDVTREYTDLEARLRNKREVETRMQELLRTRTGNVKQLMEAEQQIHAVTEEIERMEAQRRYWDQTTALSTLTVVMHEPMPTALPDSRWARHFEPVSDALKAAGNSLIQVAALCIGLLVFLLPWGLAGWLVWKGVRRIQSRKAEAATP